MTAKADFNAEEWSTLVQAPLLAAMHVAAAERGGTIRESLAAARAYTEARQHQGTSPLLDAIVASPPALDPSQIQQAGAGIAGHAKEQLRQATGIVDAKASSAEGSAYKQFILTVAEAAANANREGGFVGIGGKPVSANEQAALDEIRAALALEAPGPERAA